MDVFQRVKRRDQLGSAHRPSSDQERFVGIKVTGRIVEWLRGSAEPSQEAGCLKCVARWHG